MVSPHLEVPELSEEQKRDLEMQQPVVLNAEIYARDQYRSGKQGERISVFLGGTCNGSQWREQLIPMLDATGFNYFNPVVPNWTPECKAEEIRQRAECNVCLYTITPKMTGVYSVAEVVDDSNKRPRNTVLCILSEDDGHVWTESQARSLDSVAALVRANGAAVFYRLDVAVEHLKLTKIIR